MHAVRAMVKPKFCQKLAKWHSPSIPHLSRLNPSAHFSSSLDNPIFAKMASSSAFLEAVKSRRTFYQLTNESTIPESRLREIVHHTITHVPSAFNSQTTRMVVLLKNEHAKLWTIIKEVYQAQLPKEKYKQAEARFNMFQAAYGTVIHAEQKTVTRLTEQRFFSMKTIPFSASFRRNSKPTKTDSRRVSQLWRTPETNALIFPLIRSLIGSEQTNGMHQYVCKREPMN